MMEVQWRDVCRTDPEFVNIWDCDRIAWSNGIENCGLRHDSFFAICPWHTLLLDYVPIFKNGEPVVRYQYPILVRPGDSGDDFLAENGFDYVFRASPRYPFQIQPNPIEENYRLRCDVAENFKSLLSELDRKIDNSSEPTKLSVLEGM